MVSRATTQVDRKLSIGFTSTSPESVNRRNPTARNTISTAQEARMNPVAHAIEPIA